MEILVLHPGALGDIMLSLPALHLLGEYHAGARITLSANLDYLDIVPETCVGCCLSLSTLPLQRLYGSQPPPEADIEYWTSFDRIVSWTGSGDNRFVENFHAIHPSVLVASWRPARNEPRHVSRIFADSLSPWIPGQRSLHPVEIRPGLHQTQFAKQWLTEHGCMPEESLIAVHPGGSGPSRRWSLDNYAQLARQLLQDRIKKLLVIEGPAEPELGRRLAEALPASRTIVAECLSLNRLAALLSGCLAYIGNDSGISHLAAALGIPCFVLFGPTLPHQWAPLGAKVTVLKDASGCAACEKGQSEGHQCLGNISPGAVRRVLLPMLQG